MPTTRLREIAEKSVPEDTYGFVGSFNPYAAEPYSATHIHRSQDGRVIYTDVLVMPRSEWIMRAESADPTWLPGPWPGSGLVVVTRIRGI